ncbi:xeroderma pigmentosum group G family protein [Reticulomyxa filosa]|uniref:Xeroderma pigmentosum group G family protein n=1 Tax=Reticulomyxa filosa TaxID=46433 RepID=X6P810_RETFI|nr:xeroderma pigmentosum group G family protein [Reticulomyxa filosa]|eukprot:ETO34670.1 xeroderma pigmentosum group G family protein [Reticulomyxa filosa]
MPKTGAAAALTWQFGFFSLFCVLSCVWSVVYFVNASTAYMWTVICAVVKSAFGIYYFSSLLKLKDSVDKIHKENLRYKKNNLELTQQLHELYHEVNRLTNIRINLQSDRDTLTRAYHIYKGFNQKFQQLLNGKAENLKFLKSRTNQIVKRWRANLVQHEKNVWNKLWDFFEHQTYLNNDNELNENENEHNDNDNDNDNEKNLSNEPPARQPGITALQFQQLIASLPAQYQERCNKIRDLLPKDAHITYQQFTQLVDAWVNESISVSDKIIDL